MCHFHAWNTFQVFFSRIVFDFLSFCTLFLPPSSSSPTELYGVCELLSIDFSRMQLALTSKSIESYHEIITCDASASEVGSCLFSLSLPSASNTLSTLTFVFLLLSIQTFHFLLLFYVLSIDVPFH